MKRFFVLVLILGFLVVGLNCNLIAGLQNKNGLALAQLLGEPVPTASAEPNYDPLTSNGVYAGATPKPRQYTCSSSFPNGTCPTGKRCTIGTGTGKSGNGCPRNDSCCL